MILRRLTQSLKEQNWTAIVIEFVLLVAGVFLGIQVSNWNAERESRQKSEIFSARLLADLRVEAWAYAYLIEYENDVLVNARRALDGLDGVYPLSDEQLVVAAYRATQYESQDRHRATYDELVSTGTIGLITDQKLRETAMMVYATTVIDQVFVEGKQSEYRLIFRRILGAQVQQALLDKCGDKIVTPLDYAVIVHSLDYPCTLDLPEDTVHAAALAIRTQAGLAPALRMRFADTGTALVNLRDSNITLVDNLREIGGHAANPVDAQLVVDLLASEGIATFTQGQYLSGGVGELPAGELLRVWVADEDVDRARAVIASREAQQSLLEDAIDPALARSWSRAWLGLGAIDDGVALRDRLLAAWSEPQRRYHTLRHLGDCLALFEAASHLAAQPAEVEIALWFHDAVYDLKAKDNEARSAAWAEQALSAAQVGSELRARVHDLIMATCHAALPATDDGRLLVDIDLSILGAEPERFDEYEVQVRQEYAWVPGPLFRRKRREILQGFLAREQIYATAWFRERFEAVARSNLQRSVARLRPWLGFW